MLGRTTRQGYPPGGSGRCLLRRAGSSSSWKTQRSAEVGVWSGGAVTPQSPGEMSRSQKGVTSGNCCQLTGVFSTTGFTTGGPEEV